MAGFEKRLDDANDALSTLGKHLGRGAGSSYKEVTSALAHAQARCSEDNKQALKDFDKVRAALRRGLPSSRVQERTTGSWPEEH